MISASKVKHLGVTYRGAEQILWWISGGGADHYVITSALPCAYDTGEPETYVFDAAPNGQITDWVERDGSFRGDCDHNRAIRGYLDALQSQRGEVR